MTSLLEFKEYIKNFYMKYETYLTYGWKFVLSLVALLAINSRIGYQSSLTSFPIVLMAALLCSIMPKNFMVFMSALFIIGHLYELSLPCMLAVVILFLIMFLLYFRFSPKDTLAVMLTPLCFFFHVPYVIPIAMGLMGTPVSIISVTCGVVVTYVIRYVAENATAFTTADAEETTIAFQSVLSELMANKAMLAVIIAFAVTLSVVYVIRRLSIDHAWSIAIITGALCDAICMLVGDLIFNTQISIISVIIGAVVAGLLAKCIEFFAFDLDYSRTENVQFEDDEYYYYVKAVPKVTVSTPEKKVKKINRSRAQQSHKRENADR